MLKHDDVTSATTSSDKEFYRSLEKFDQQLNVIYPLVLIAFGTTGNLITFYIYTRKCFRHTSFGFYYSCLALVDTLALCIGSIKFYLNAIEYVNLTTYSTFSCKFFTSSIYILAQFSAWIIVLTNIDRLILVIWPHIARHSNSSSHRKYIYILVASLGLIILALNVPNIYFLHISREYLLDANNSFELVSTCELGNKTALYNNNIADIMDLFIFSLIPFAIMIVSSLVISVTIFRSRIRLKQKYGRHLLSATTVVYTESKRKKKKNLQFSFTILCTNFLFLILNLPICLILLIRNFKREDEYFYESRVKLDFAFTIANILAYFNFSNSIIIHFCFNKLFRSRLKEAFFCCFKSSARSEFGVSTLNVTTRRDASREKLNCT